MMTTVYVAISTVMFMFSDKIWPSAEKQSNLYKEFFVVFMEFFGLVLLLQEFGFINL